MPLASRILFRPVKRFIQLSNAAIATALVTSTSGGTTITSGSFTPTPNEVLLISVHARDDAAITFNDPTATGITFTTAPTLIASAADNMDEGTGQRYYRASLWWCVPASGTGTIACAATTSLFSRSMTCTTIPGARLTTPVVQSKTANNQTGTTITCTMDAACNASNILFAVLMNGGGDNGAMTATSNFTELDDGAVGTVSRIHTQYDRTMAGTAIAYTGLTSGRPHLVVAAEIRERGRA